MLRQLKMEALPKLAAVLFLLTLSVSFQAPKAPARISPEFFGMDVIDPNAWPAVPIGALGKGAGTGWRYLEPSRGEFRWYGTDKYVRAASSHGVDLLYTFDATPQWAASRPAEACGAGPIGCASPPRDVRDWEDFVTALVTRYKGRLKIYELWNEPTTQLEWSGTYTEMVNLARSAYHIIKSIDASAIVLTPAPSAKGYQPHRTTSPIQSEWMREYLKAGGDAFADAASFHAYPLPNTCLGLDCAGAPLEQQVETMRAALDYSRLAGKPLYVTEGGWRTNTELPDVHEQAAYVARWHVLLASSGIARAYWHAWDDGRWGTLWDPATGLRLAGIAYQQIHSWLTGAELEHGCTFSRDRLWTCPITYQNGSRALLLWSASGVRSYRPDPQFTRRRTLSGGVEPVSATIMIDQNPVLLDSSSKY